MSAAVHLDLERVICRLAELGEGVARGFVIGQGDWPLRGFIVRSREQVRGYLNRCPHAGHPLNLRPHQFLSPDGALIVCSSHGALFEKLTGFCVAGPCFGHHLQAVPLKVEEGWVLLAESTDVAPASPP